MNIDVASMFTLTAGDDVFIADQFGYATALEIEGGAGNDYISTSNVPGGPGFPYADTVYGGEGNDLIITGSGNDFVDAGAGDDVIAARGGNETVIGGAGNDTFVLRFFRNVASATTDTGTTTVTDNDGVLWNGSFRPDPFPAAWTPAPTATQGFLIAGTATFVSAGVWDLAVSDDSAAIKHLTINWTGHDLTMTGGNETLVIKDYVNGTFGVTLENVKVGTSGNDTLLGSGGFYSMLGVAGDDTYVVDDGHDAVIENANEGTDLVQASIDYTLTANVENLTLLGTADLVGYGNALANTLTGNAGSNLLNGLAGADVMLGGDGNDAYFVDNAGDIVTENANEGSDTVYATAHFRLSANVENLVMQGSDDLQAYGNASVNVLYGNAGSNLLDGDAGIDAMYGGAGNDSYMVDNAGDLVIENANEGIDTVYSTAHLRLGENIENLILQGSADLQGYGNSLSNAIYGNAGSNILDGGIGGDSMYGGAGNDTYYVDNAGDVLVENPNEGFDTVFSTVGLTLTANVEILVLQGSADLQGYGNSLSNVLYGNAGNNILDGGAGGDAMYGGAGDDIYYVDNAGDVVIEAVNAGADAVFSTVSYSLSPEVETLVLQGGADLQGYGNSGANTLYGNSGNNILDGGGAADVMYGGLGDDLYYVDNAGDMVVENASEGADAVFASVNYTLTANVETLVLQGAGNLSGTGNADANNIIGNSADNILDGGAGADGLTGGAGNDTFVFHMGEGGGDTVVDFAGNGAAAGNSLQFVGYGPGATFTNVDATHWQISFNGGASQEIITFMNAASIDATDFIFV